MRERLKARDVRRGRAESEEKAAPKARLPYQWTVDSWVLYAACEPRNELFARAIGFLDWLIVDGRICLDEGGVIRREYQACFEQYRQGFPLKWFDRMQRSGRIDLLPPRLGKRLRQRLLELRFHEDDIVYVGVAAASRDKTIITGDSDYNRQVVQCLLEHGIAVRRLEEFSVSVEVKEEAAVSAQDTDWG